MFSKLVSYGIPFIILIENVISFVNCAISDKLNQIALMIFLALSVEILKKLIKDALRL